MLKYTQLCINHLKPQTTLLTNQANVALQPSRNTYILKRRHVPPLHKKYEKFTKLKHKHYIYDLVEDTNAKPQKYIDMVLLTNVKDVGEKGQKVSMRSQRAYETLILPKLAVYATPENLEKYLIEDKEDRKKLQEFSSQFVERTMNLLSQLYLPLNMSLDTPWTIEKWHVKASFRKAGYIVPENTITMPTKPISGPDLSIESREFYVVVTINNQEEVKVRCKIFHYTSNPEKKIKYDVPYYMLPNIAVFPEDQDIINSLPKHRLFIKQNDNVEE
ncbi:39S ribosomal protein L9, mitochondrial [Ceratina calcarata]|uniref:Large ribosomal subunit protein bL9m n=1 Tax=Ceratina calcarata TaxID=156304 RepID=A0AAJ7JFA2_9HYME|nr:39S ribosomal protein L9, mitochondrial [Ceratina calcarata]